MSQQEIQEIRPWVIITVFKENINPNDLQNISPQIQNLVDEWQSQGKMLWSGAFNDDATSMTVFEGTEQEANELYSKYDKICSRMLQYSMYQWDAMPILSVLSK